MKAEAARRLLGSGIRNVRGSSARRRHVHQVTATPVTEAKTGEQHGLDEVPVFAMLRLALSGRCQYIL